MTSSTVELADGRKMGPVMASFLVAGNMVGSGVYLLPVTLGTIGSVSILGWAVASVGALILAGVFVLLNRIRSTNDGLVAYVSQALGRFFGFEAAFAYWLTCTVGNVAIALAAVGYLAHFFPALKTPIGTAGMAAALIWLFTVANILGPRLVGRLHGLSLGIGLLPILAAATLGWLYFDPQVFSVSWNVSGKSDLNAVGLSLVMVVWAFLGLESASICARVVRDPPRTVPVATFAGVGMAAVLYMLASAAVMGVLPAAELAVSTAPFADVVAKVAGAGVAAVVAACAVIKACGTLGGWILLTAETTRSSAAAGYFPRLLSGQRADGVPVRDLIVLAALMTIIAFMTMSATLGGQFNTLANVSTNLALAAYALCCVALLKFSGAMTSGRLVAQATAVAGLAFCVWVVAVSDPDLLMVQLWLFLISLPLFALVWWAARRPAAAP